MSVIFVRASLLERWILPTIQQIALNSVEDDVDIEQSHPLTTALLDLLIESRNLLFERRGRIGSMRIQDIDLDLASVDVTISIRDLTCRHLGSLQTLQT